MDLMKIAYTVLDPLLGTEFNNAWPAKVLRSVHMTTHKTCGGKNLKDIWKENCHAFSSACGLQQDNNEFYPDTGKPKDQLTTKSLRAVLRILDGRHTCSPKNEGKQKNTQNKNQNAAQEEQKQPSGAAKIKNPEIKQQVTEAIQFAQGRPNKDQLLANAAKWPKAQCRNVKLGEIKLQGCGEYGHVAEGCPKQTQEVLNKAYAHHDEQKKSKSRN